MAIAAADIELPHFPWPSTELPAEAPANEVDAEWCGVQWVAQPIYFVNVAITLHWRMRRLGVALLVHRGRLPGQMQQALDVVDSVDLTGTGDEVVDHVLELARDPVDQPRVVGIAGEACSRVCRRLLRAVRAPATDTAEPLTDHRPPARSLRTVE